MSRALRLCVLCAVPHYENCRTCFGFGVYPGAVERIVPVSASEAITGPAPDGAKACPECDSTVRGAPRSAFS